MSVAKKEILQNDYSKCFPHFNRNKPSDSEYFPGNSKTLPVCHRNGLHCHGKPAMLEQIGQLPGPSRDFQEESRHGRANRNAQEYV